MKCMTSRYIGEKSFDFINNFLLVIVFAIVLYPLIYVISASFSTPETVIRGEVWVLPKGFTLQAYEKVFRNEDIITGYINTIKYTVVGTTVNIIMTILAAYPLSRRDFFGRSFFTILFTLTMFFSGGLIPTYMVVRSLGLIDRFWVMIIPNAVAMIYIIIMRTFFQTGIPIEIQESAKIDGCSNTRILYNIVLPLSAPILAVMVLFYGVGHWNAFFNALIYITKKERYPLQLVLREILIQSQMGEMFKSGSETAAKKLMMAESIKYAVIVVTSVPVLMLYPFLQKYFVKGIMIGAIKG